MDKVKYLILGAGISGLSASYHLGHHNCLILEKEKHSFGLLHSYIRDDFTWDLGPHVSFTKNEYVKDIFLKSVGSNYYQKEVKVGNYFNGYWIDHPVQTNLYQVPEPLRTDCLKSFLQKPEIKNLNDYNDWLISSLGKTITDNFVSLYTQKYWTLEPKQLSLDWIANRIYKPKTEDVNKGFKGKLNKKTHYINSIRYPKHGGYQSFGDYLHKNANIRHSSEIVEINTIEKTVKCKDGSEYSFECLISTIPLPKFIQLLRNVSEKLINHAKNLSCTQLLLVNVEAEKYKPHNHDWIYVYDQDKFSTRINFTENLSKFNTPKNKTGIQIEVYFSKYKPLNFEIDYIKDKVINELFDMRILNNNQSKSNIKSHYQWIEYANIIFDHKRKDSLSNIFKDLLFHGLSRKNNDIEPTSDWGNSRYINDGNVFLLGRHGEWKYYWSDDCIISGKRLADFIQDKL